MLLNGKEVAQQIHEEIRVELANLKEPPPFLVAVLVGEDLASQLYVRNKMRACDKAGIRSERRIFPDSMTEAELLQEIERLNGNPEVSGILVQLPLPSQINPLHIAQAIHPAKDVDGVHPFNFGKLLMGDTTGLVACTPLGIQVLLERSAIRTAGAHVVIAGRSNIVGKPLAALLVQRGLTADATVTLVHSKTKDIGAITRQADILVAAIGKAHYFTKDLIKEGAVVIDVGQNRLEDSSRKTGYRLVGDVDYESVRHQVQAITPVPGGVGPMTIAMLLQNTLTAYKRQKYQ